MIRQSTKVRRDSLVEVEREEAVMIILEEDPIMLFFLNSKSSPTSCPLQIATTLGPKRRRSAHKN